MAPKLLIVPLFCTGLLATACTSEEPTLVPAQHRAAITCGQTPAPALFAHSACLCGALDSVGQLTLRAGSADPTLAVNGKVTTTSEVRVDGDLLAYGGLQAVAEMSVGGNLISGADVRFTGELLVSGNLEAQGNLDGVGTASIGGDLAIRGETDVVGELSVVGSERAAAPMQEPCPCNGPALLDPAAIVAAARTANDNEALEVSASALTEELEQDLVLQTGRYFFEGADAVGTRHVRIEGTVAMYIAGGLSAVGAERFELAEGASLDLYVEGSVETVGELRLGDATAPGAFRLYIGGTEPAMITVGDSSIAGAIYAPHATLQWVGDTKVTGAIFAKDLDGVGNIEIEYHRPVANEVPVSECPVDPASPENADQIRDV